MGTKSEWYEREVGPLKTGLSRSRRLQALVVALFACGVAACGNSQARVDDSISPSTTSPIAVDSGVTRPMLLDSIERLSSVADLVVLGTAGDRVSSEKIVDLEMKVTNFDVTRTLRADSLAEGATTVPVMQEDSLFEGVDVRLKPGQQYLLFLQHFEYEPGKPFGPNYVVVGGATGVFQLTGQSGSDDVLAATLDNTPGMETLQKGVSIAEIERIQQQTAKSG